MRISFLLFPFTLLFLTSLSAAAFPADGPEGARQVLSFNDSWQFRIAEADAWEDVTLPHTWNADDMQLRVEDFYQGEATYRKVCNFPEEWKDRRLFLRFEGVGSCARVYVNGVLVGEHRGGYSAFACEIQQEVHFGQDNEITVIADNASRPDVIPVNHFLFGVYGGIYRPVSLIVTDRCNIAVTDHASSGVYITQKDVSRESARISVRTKLDNGGLRTEPLVLESVIEDMEGQQVASQRSDIELSAQGMQEFRADFTLDNPRLWQGRRDPYLYRVCIRLYRDGSLIDEVVQPLGVRKFEIVAGEGFYLNGERWPMYGVCRHQDWLGSGSALTKGQHDTDLAMIMDIGATTVRLAHYQQSDYIYSKCDSLGLIVWAEIPFVNKVTGEEWENAHRQLRELIRQSFNHPSIYTWGLHNEVYKPHAYTAALTQSLHDLAKTEDPDRYTAAVNGHGHADHPVNLNSDIQGMNRYYGWYEREITDIDAWVEGLEENYPDMKLMLTEYGADANTAHQTEYLGESLDWSKQFYPETFQTKTHEYQWAVISRHPYIIASYLWNMFDFACPMWERGGIPARNMKGLVTFDRQVKKDSYYWYKANWSEEPVLYLTQRRNTDREKRVTSITVYSNCGTPTVWLNGRKLKGIRQGYTDVHYIIDEVTLRKGDNVIRAAVTAPDGQTLEDRIEWTYTGEKNRGLESRERLQEHAGF